MDTITHAFSGILLGRATTSNNNNRLSLRARLSAGFFSAMFPDLDIVARFSGMIAYLESHRGITHSVILLPVWAMLLAVIFSKLSRNKYHWKDFYWISFGGIAIHIAGDMITAYGTMVFAPFSIAKFAWPTTFIIDFYFSGIILLALLMGAIFRAQAKQIAITGLAVLVSYIGYQSTLHHQAIDLAKNYAKKQQWHNVDVSAMPQPFSPFRWKVVINTGDDYIISYINLIGDQIYSATEQSSSFEKLAALYRPIGQLTWLKIPKFGNKKTELAKQVWSLEMMKPIREFMMYPAVDYSYQETKEECVWFKDQRFVLEGIRQGPFGFGACKTSGQDWKLFRLNDSRRILIFK